MDKINWWQNTFDDIDIIINNCKILNITCNDDGTARIIVETEVCDSHGNVVGCVQIDIPRYKDGVAYHCWEKINES